MYIVPCGLNFCKFNFAVLVTIREGLPLYMFRLKITVPTKEKCIRLLFYRVPHIVSRSENNVRYTVCELMR